MRKSNNQKEALILEKYDASKNKCKKKQRNVCKNMSKFKPDLTREGLIFGYNVEDFLPEDHIARLIEEIVNQLDTRKIEAKYSVLGQKGYEPKSLIKIIFYGYTIGVFGSRKMMNGCRQDLAFMYLSKLYRPDFRTISDFRKNNLSELEKYFVDILKYCNELGLLKMGKIAIDGSKFRANASGRRSKTLSGYEKWEQRLREEIKELNKKAEAVDREENNRLKEKTAETTIPKEIRKREKLIERIEEAKTELTKVKRKLEKQNPKKEPKINLTDLDATFQKGKKGVKDTNYNAQIATTEEQLIVGADVTKNSADTEELIPMIEQVELNTEEKVNEVKADAGYGSCENYKELEERGIDGYIPDLRFKNLEKELSDETLNPYYKNRFKYDEQKDIYICPEGRELHLIKLKKYKHKPNEKIYKCTSCTGCKARQICSPKNKKTIKRIEHEECRDRMRKKLLTPEGKKKYYERMNMAESPYGHLKKNLGFWQFLLRGIEKVKSEFKILCIGFNIMKIHKWRLAQV